MISDTATRVPEHSPPPVNERIVQELQDRLAAFSGEGKTELINSRIAELDREWDIERTLQTNFAIVSLLGLGLAAQGRKRWYGLVFGVPAFMAQHALQGWCPPLAILRRLGFRTSKEINEERFALKSLRGDFRDLTRTSDPETIFDAIK